MGTIRGYLAEMIIPVIGRATERMTQMGQLCCVWSGGLVAVPALVGALEPGPRDGQDQIARDGSGWSFSRIATRNSRSSSPGPRATSDARQGKAADARQRKTSNARRPKTGDARQTKTSDARQPKGASPDPLKQRRTGRTPEEIEAELRLAELRRALANTDRIRRDSREPKGGRPEQEEKTGRPKKKEQVRLSANRGRIRSMSRAVVIILLITLVLGFLLFNQSEVLQISFENAKIENQINKLTIANTQQRSELVERTDLVRVRERAIALGLIEPGEKQIRKVEIPVSDSLIVFKKNGGEVPGDPATGGPVNGSQAAGEASGMNGSDANGADANGSDVNGAEASAAADSAADANGSSDTDTAQADVSIQEQDETAAAVEGGAEEVPPTDGETTAAETAAQEEGPSPAAAAGRNEGA